MKCIVVVVVVVVVVALGFAYSYGVGLRSHTAVNSLKESVTVLQIGSSSTFLSPFVDIWRWEEQIPLREHGACPTQRVTVYGYTGCT